MYSIQEPIFLGVGQLGIVWTIRDDFWNLRRNYFFVHLRVIFWWLRLIIGISLVVLLIDCGRNSLSSLRSCPDVGKLYVLMRSKKGKSLDERFKEQFEGPVSASRWVKVKTVYQPTYSGIRNRHLPVRNGQRIDIVSTSNRCDFRLNDVEPTSSRPTISHARLMMYPNQGG